MRHSVKKVSGYLAGSSASPRIARYLCDTGAHRLQVVGATSRWCRVAAPVCSGMQQTYRGRGLRWSQSLSVATLRGGDAYVVGLAANESSVKVAVSSQSSNDSMSDGRARWCRSICCARVYI